MGILKAIWHSVAGTPPKFEFTTEMINHKGNQLKRIRALRRIELNFHGNTVIVNPGDLGGFVAFNPHNPDDGSFHLPHGNESWVGGNAKCCGLSKLSGNSLLTGSAVLEDQVEIFDSFVGEAAHISGWAKLHYSIVFGNASIRDAKIHSSWVLDRVRINGPVDLGTCAVYDDAKITVTGKFSSIYTIKVFLARIFGDADIRYPVERQSGNYGLGPYEKKSVSGGVIDSAAAFDAAETRGSIKDLGRVGCLIRSPHGYEQIEAVLPLKSITPSIHK